MYGLLMSRLRDLLSAGCIVAMVNSSIAQGVVYGKRNRRLICVLDFNNYNN